MQQLSRPEAEDASQTAMLETATLQTTTLETATLQSTRERLSRSALSELSTRGWVNLTVTRVARAAGMTTGAVYSCFRSREELIAAAYMSRLDYRQNAAELNLGVVAQAVFTTETPDGEQLWEFAGSLASPTDTRERLITLDTILAARHNPTLESQLRPALGAAISHVQTLIEVSQRAGVTRSDLPAHEMAVAWTAALLGVASTFEVIGTGSVAEVEQDRQTSLFILMQVFAVAQVPVPTSGHQAPDRQPPSRPARTSRRVRNSATRTALIDATIEALDAQGSYEFRVVDVARNAGFTTGALYAEFGSRDGAIAAAHLTRLEETLAVAPNMIDFARFVYTVDPEDVEATAELAGVLVRPEVRNRRLFALEALVAANHNPILQADLVPLMEGAADEVAVYVAASQAAGQTRDELPAIAVASAWLGSAMGLSALAAILTLGDTPDEIARSFTVNSALLHAFKTTPWTRVFTVDDLSPANR
jgi:AcrR family transcriptional regulator